MHKLFTNGQDEGLLGLPLDFDIFGSDFGNVDFNKEEDIFNDNKYTETSDKSPEETIRRICNEYDLILDNRSIDCKNLRLTQKILKIDERNIHKREADDETQLEEGSGAGEEEPEVAPELPINEEPAENSALEQPVEEAKGDDTAPLEPEEEQPVEESPPEVKESPPETTDPSTGEEVKIESETDAKITENPVEQTEGEPNVNETTPPSEGEQPKESPAETENAPYAKEADVPAVIPGEEIAQSTTIDDNRVQQKAETSAAPVETKDIVTESVVTQGVVKKKGRVLRPDATDTDKANSGNAEADKVNIEPLHEHQSEQAAAGSEEQKTGESAKDIQEARKDNKILIILFVAVVVVGGAAFAYNFIKKRKQKKDETARVENGGE
ncbi:hypothetical protein NQ314_014685 [Rhamnusium bicolor]|uniref:Uncharacterized protein n=1 Tax=Rhamnusium bicolor TaxID=1586634 RepID=A0AAV8X178_9CUCU|nr:hypothetical protein NQ314_014685 [Rhamnusium bicolor]